MKQDRGELWFPELKVTLLMRRSSELSREVAVIPDFFLLLEFLAAEPALFSGFKVLPVLFLKDHHLGKFEQLVNSLQFILNRFDEDLPDVFFLT